jgi:hypothetical protein
LPQPLKHKDKLIKQETRERFEALDLETLLSEFRRVAETEVRKQQGRAPSSGTRPHPLFHIPRPIDVRRSSPLTKGVWLGACASAGCR